MAKKVDGSTVSASWQLVPAEGWMADGYGAVDFTFSNKSAKPAKVVSFAGQYMVAGKKVGKAFDEKVNLVLPPGKKTTHRQIGHLSRECAAKAADGVTSMVGQYTVQAGPRKMAVPFSVDIPEARLTEKLKLVSGRHVGLNLRLSAYKGIKRVSRTLKFLDEAYGHMAEMTGFTPYNGKVIVLQDSPAHPWYAYAGNPIVLNTKFVENDIRKFDVGEISFGWLHEIGHDFDFGGWYIWSGPAAEWQANIKLAYAAEKMSKWGFVMGWPKSNRASAYGPPAGADLPKLAPYQFNDSFYLCAGDPYLADCSRTWQSMTSDDIFSFHFRLVRIYGWDAFKMWYRGFAKLEKMGLKRPTTPEGKIQLGAAILMHVIGADLLGAYERWRLPVTAADIRKMNKKYPIDKLAR